MTPRSRNFVFGIVVVGAIATGALLSSRPRAEEPATSQPAAEEKTPVASVKTAPLRVGEITQTIVAYGNVTAQPGEVAVYSLPLECRVKHVRVTGGQTVEKGTPLIEVEPSPDAKVQLIEARNALEAAKRELALAQQRFEMKLATNLELGQAQEAVKSAQIKLDALQDRGAGDEQHVITADGPGVVSKVDVQEGQVVPAGGPLVESVPHDRIEVRLGVEPSDIRRLRPDQSVKIVPAGADADDATAGKIRLIAQRVSPESRLVDVFVTPGAPEEPATQPTTEPTSAPSTEAAATTQPTTNVAESPAAEPAAPSPLLLDGLVRGELTAESKQAMVVPRDAVLPDDDGFTLFTVAGGKAVKHTVKIGLQNDKEVEVIGEGLHAGDAVVVLGNLELEDGMAVATTDSTAGAARD